MGAGFVTPLPYNYYKLKKYGKSCHSTPKTKVVTEKSRADINNKALTKLEPGKPLPEITLPLVKGGNEELAKINNEGRWKLIVAYRGKHCPLCTSYLAQLQDEYQDILKNSIDVIAISADSKYKAEIQVSENSFSFPVGYGLNVAQMQSLGLYISDPISKKESDRPFSEPGVFVLNPEGILHVVDISNAPFARPDLKLLISGLNYIRKPAEQRHDAFGGLRYPIRGRHITHMMQSKKTKKGTYKQNSEIKKYRI